MPQQYKKFRKHQLSWPTKDWLVSHIILDQAIDAILHRVKLNRNYDIPYVAGYSKDGKTIYIDRHMPKTLLINGRRVKTDRFLILHEAVEKTLIDRLGLHYQFAHQIALRTEQAAVRADKISWKEYDRMMQRYIKEIGDERLQKIPANLDTKPYLAEHDEALYRRMERKKKDHAS